MNWHLFNTIVLLASLTITIMALGKLFSGQGNKTSNSFCWVIITSNFSIQQALLVDSNMTTLYPVLLLLFIPFQLMSPVLFAIFTCCYLDRMELFRKHRLLLWTPFFLFFIFFTWLHVNLVLGNHWLSEQPIVQVGVGSYEIISVSFTFSMGIWNYNVIKGYEHGLGDFPYQLVHKKTKWLKNIFKGMVAMAVVWASVIIYNRTYGAIGGFNPYYGLWFLFLAFICLCLIWASRHLKKIAERKETEVALFREVSNNFRISALNNVFTSVELDAIQGSRYEVTGILSYFATSLFDKNKADDVLWDIARNCIAKLDLEDCVIYLLDRERNMLLQKAAYGNKHLGEKKILSPIEIPVGKGIVGSVAKTLQWELIGDIAKDGRYIVDDKIRCSELAVPIISEDGLLGVLDSEHSERDFFRERHIFIFQLIAKLTATKLRLISKKNPTFLTNGNAYYKELCRLLDEERIYTDPELSLSAIAEKLDISGNYLSQLVNKLSGHNLSDLVNLYRISDAKAKLTDPGFSNYTVMGIAHEAGFNSRSAFYEAFKKHTGMTPSQYRRQNPNLS